MVESRPIKLRLELAGGKPRSCLDLSTSARDNPGKVLYNINVFLIHGESFLVRYGGEGEKILASFFMNARSPLTAREYRLASEEFFRFLAGEVKKPEDLRRHPIVLYIKWLEGKRLSNKTILKKLSCDRHFCERDSNGPFKLQSGFHL